MEPKFQSSFIPRKPVVDSPKMMGPVTTNRNIFSVIATFAFIITLLATAGVFVYGRMVENNIKEADAKVSEARSAFEADKIKDLIDASTRLDSIDNLLKNHYAVSQVFVLLQNLTLKNMRFDNLSYKNLDGRPTLSMDSEATGYNTIANQKEVFEQNNSLSNVQFSGFSLGDGGIVKSKISAEVSPKLVSYKELIDSTQVDSGGQVNTMNDGSYNTVPKT